MVKITQSTKPISEKKIERSWHLIDVKNKVLGREIPRITMLLVGKHKVEYVPYLDLGDYVVVINAKGVILTGRKAKTKIYSRYSGYPSGLKEISFAKLIKDDPAKIITHAVTGMLPKNKLRKRRLARLYVFSDEKNPYKDRFEILNPK